MSLRLAKAQSVKGFPSVVQTTRHSWHGCTDTHHPSKLLPLFMAHAQATK